MTQTTDFFARPLTTRNEHGADVIVPDSYAVLYTETGEPVTRIGNGPELPDGVVLTARECGELGIEIEQLS